MSLLYDPCSPTCRASGDENSMTNNVLALDIISYKVCWFAIEVYHMSSGWFDCTEPSLIARCVEV